MQFSTCKGRLEYVGSIDCPFGPSCPDQRMELIDEEDDIPCLTDLIHHFFQAVLELTTVFRSGYDGSHIEGHDTLITEDLRYFIRDDLLGKAFSNRRLTHTRFTDKDRIVLRTAA